MITNFYDKLENTIGEPPDGIYFDFATTVIQYNEDTRNKEVKRELKIRLGVVCDKKGDIHIVIEEYVEKLKELYPNM